MLPTKQIILTIDETLSQINGISPKDNAEYKLPDHESLYHSVSELLTRLQEPHHDPTVATTGSIWRSIEYLVNTQEPKPLKYGLTLWVRWLGLPHPVSIEMDNYWSLIHCCFRRSLGNSTLQKFCIHILRKSILTLDIDVDDQYMSFIIEKKSQYVDAYSKYCSFFETIIIGRYMNQVEECLVQFPGFSGCLEPFDGSVENAPSIPTSNPISGATATGVSVVKGPWWILLFSAGLRQQNSDIIRKVIGTYLLENYHPSGHSSNLNTENEQELHSDFSVFLSDAVLPWAAQGQLLNKTIRRIGQEVWTDHGNKLAAFCEALATNDRQNVKTVLQYLVNVENKRNGHAAAYILQGLNLSQKWEPDLEIAELGLKLPEALHLSHRQRTIVLHQCLTITQRFHPEQYANLDGMKHSKSNESWESRQQKLADVAVVETRPFLELREDRETSSKCANNIFRSSTLSLDDFEVQTRGENGPKYIPCPHTPGTCFHGKLLLPACEFVVQAFEAATTLDQNLAIIVLHRVFFEFERQDHPSILADILPQAILHPHLTVACATNVNVRDSIKKYIHKIYEICKGNVYFWKPLARALRRAYIDCPGILQLLNVDDIMIAFVNDPPTPKPEFLLDAGLAKREREIFSNPLAIYADESCGHACVLDVLNRLRPEDKAWAQNLAERLLQRWLNQREPVSVVSSWKRTSQLQALLLLSETSTLITDGSGPEQQVLHIATIMQVLSIEPLPRYRFLLEWIIISAATRMPRSIAITDCMLQLLEHADHVNPKLVSSLVKITTQLVMNATSEETILESKPNNSTTYTWSTKFESQFTDKLTSFVPEDLAPSLARSIKDRLADTATAQDSEASTIRLLATLNAFIASPKINIKFEAMWCYANLYIHSVNNAYLRITNNPAFSTMFKFFEGLEKYKNPPESRVFEEFDVRKDRSLGTLFGGGYLRVEPVEASLATVEDFQNLGTNGGKLPQGRLPLGVSIHSPKAANEAPIAREEQAEAVTELPTHIKSTPLQTKSYNLPQTLTPLPTTPLDLSTAASSAGNGPILIGTLLEIPHNLGGLSRVAEIFGCSALHVPSLAVLKNGQFKNVAVNSETHISIEETPISTLIAFLKSKKAEGYVIIGVEQTDESVVLGAGDGARQMAEKSVVVMGAERTGIPADILVECNWCVEIKQWGVTRSLNVQTAAAVVLYEWRRVWG